VRLEARSLRFLEPARVYEAALTVARDKLRDKHGLTARILRGTEKIRTIDSQGVASFGIPTLLLTVGSSVAEHEIAVLHVVDPTALTLICWRRSRGNGNAKTFHKVSGSALPAGEILNDRSLAEKFVNDALSAATIE
jgi:hypothetical protein